MLRNGSFTIDLSTRRSAGRSVLEYGGGEKAVRRRRIAAAAYWTARTGHRPAVAIHAGTIHQRPVAPGRDDIEPQSPQPHSSMLFQLHTNARQRLRRYLRQTEWRRQRQGELFNAPLSTPESNKTAISIEDQR